MVNPVSESHPFTGLFAGDYFIHCFDFDGQTFFAYGLVREIGLDGRYHVDSQSQHSPTKAFVPKQDQRVIGRISKRAYALARMRHWPNSEAGVLAVLDYSTGKLVALSVSERLRLLLVH